MQLLKRLLILFGPALYVIAACLLLATFVGFAGYGMLQLTEWGVPGIVALLVCIIGLPAVVVFAFFLLKALLGHVNRNPAARHR